MAIPPGKEYEIDSDGRTVWINGPILLGRFSKNGIDVHVDAQCIDGSCSPGACGLKEWREFQVLMHAHHEIDVPDNHMPKYLKELP